MIQKTWHILLSFKLKFYVTYITYVTYVTYITYGYLRLQLSFVITGLFREVGRQCKEEIKTGTASFGFADSKFGDALPSKTRI